ncbi:MAG: phosphate ABC transporter substrate-binding/OmpA family protein [Paracoccaceae bacterium]
MNIFRTAIFAVLFQLSLAAIAVAQDVTLTSRDGSVKISGSLLGYDGDFYRIDSEFGILTVDGSGVLCSGPGCPDLVAFVANISMSGAPVIARDLMPGLIEAFALAQNYVVERSAPGTGEISYVLTEADSGRAAVRFVISSSSSDEGFADLLAEETDMALSLRAVSSDEIARGLDAGLGRFSSPGQNRVIALDALIPVVSPRNPVRSISPEQLAQVFAGQIDNWQQLGGLDAPISLHLRQRGAGILQVFSDRIMSAAALEPVARVVRHDSNPALVDAVSKDPFAIGISTLSEPGNTRTLFLAGGCGFRSAAAPDALKSDDYPLTAPMYLYLKGRRLPAVGREFLRFVRSPEAQVAILRAGFVDQAISRTPLNRQGDRLANAIRAAGDEVPLTEIQRMVAVMDGARRLSVTFRFDGGSSALDAQSRSNILLLARALETGTIGAHELIFVGFSDGQGAAEANRRLSETRAASVRAAVRREAATADPGRVKLSVDGFGEAMPLACDDTQWGRQTNRRVEVWAR